MKQMLRLDPTIASQTPPVVFSLIAECLSDDPLPAVQRIERGGLWEYVAAESCDAQVGAVLLDRLTRLGVDVPESAAGQMQAYREHVTAANAYKFAEVGRVLSRLRLADIPFLLLKGAALNATVYEPGLRPMTDIDVLVRPSDVGAADRVLANAGCQAGADLLRADFYPRYYYEREYFTRRNPSVKIDLHCRPFRLLRYARTVPDNAMWGDCREVQLGGMNGVCEGVKGEEGLKGEKSLKSVKGITVRIPGPEDMLIHLAVHSACHGNSHLRWLYDIRLWIEQFGGEIDVKRLADKCRRWQLSLPVNRALAKTRNVLGCKDEVLDAAIRATSTIAGPMERLALAVSPIGLDAPVLYTAASVLSTPGIRFRLGYLSAVLLPEPAHLAQIYHRRHPGWQLAAHAVRLGRCITRVWAGPAASIQA